MESMAHFIIPGLYLGNMRASADAIFLQENKITHILVAGCDLEQYFPNMCKYHQIHVDDAANVDVLSHMTECMKFIEEGIKNGNILVHCAAGISRSSTLVIAYVMKTKKWDFQKAFMFVYSKRKCVLPNMGFQDQLRLFHKLEYNIDLEHPEIKQFLDELKQQKRFGKGLSARIELQPDGNNIEKEKDKNC